MKLYYILTIVCILGISCNKSETVKVKTTSLDESASKYEATLGLPQIEIPLDNPMTKAKIALGEKLFNDTRFSSTGQVSCATCHAPDKAFTDHLQVSEGINKLKGTRNAPTVINSVFNTTQFWDGRSPTLEDQARHPIINPVEMGLKDHEPVLKIVREDPEYKKAFKEVFGKEGEAIQVDDVMKAIGAFERTIVSGNSRFDRWYFKGEDSLTESEIRGFQAFLGNGRCVSCHTVEQTTATFIDGKFHDIGVGINRVPTVDLDRLAGEYLRADYNREEVDEKVLTDAKSSELGRFAVTRNTTEMGAFKTPTLRNIDKTAPYMHDGSLKTLEEVIDHYNRGGASSDQEVITPFLSGGIRPLNLTEQEKQDLVAFLKALTSPEFEK